MNGWIDYDYAVLRVVPHVHREMFTPVGVALHARTARFLDVRFRPEETLRGVLDDARHARLVRFLDAYRRVAAGGAAGGPIGLLPPSERFHWLTAPRSAVLQASPVHAGRTRDPAAELDRLFADCVDGG